MLSPEREGSDVYTTDWLFTTLWATTKQLKLLTATNNTLWAVDSMW